LQKVLGHEALLTQALSNLLSNALRFVEPGKQARVRLWTEPLPKASEGEKNVRVRINIEDNGIGIAPNDQERIWGIFIRLHPEHYGGTGIGLAIVRKAVERMGGLTGVDSTPGQGSRFWLEIPSAPASAPPESLRAASLVVPGQPPRPAAVAALIKPQAA
jgi:signal transduction histidine kinase